MPIRWDEVDDFVREAAVDAAAAGRLVAPTFLVYADADVEPVAVVTLTAFRPDEQVARTCAGVFAPLRPTRLVALWPLVVEVPDAAPVHLSDDGYVHGVRVVRGIVEDHGNTRWTVADRRHRRRDGRVVGWEDPPRVRPLDTVPCPLASGLRPVLDDRVQRGSSPLLDAPGPPYEVFVRPDVLGVGPLGEEEYVRHGGRPHPRARTS